MVNISNLPSTFASVVVVLFYFSKKRKRETMTGRRSQTDSRTINKYFNACVYVQACIFLYDHTNEAYLSDFLHKSSICISRINHTKEAFFKVHKSSFITNRQGCWQDNQRRKTDGRQSAGVCPLGGDEERKRKARGRFKIINNDPEYFKNVCYTFPPQLRVVTSLSTRANHWNC